MSEIIAVAVDWAWGTPLVLLLMGGGLYLTFVGRFIPLLGFAQAIRLISGKVHHEGDDKDPGQLSHFKALTNALSATVGLGNIAGVAVAISQGGPGAIFWMWLSALIGMNTKFFECTLAVMFRGKDYAGEVQGGPMYVIEKALPRPARFLAYLFAGCGMVGALSLYQVNQLSSYVVSQYPIAPAFVGVTTAVFVGYILLGGVRRIAELTSKVVPFMCVLYVMSCLTIIGLNFEAVPDIFLRIFKEAFSGTAVAGGALGVGVMEVLKIGVKRAAFSNEAGVGTAPLAHGNAKTTEPIAEGLVAMLGPFLDTILICTMTALVILVTFPEGAPKDLEGVLMTLEAFETNLPVWGKHFLGVAVVLFSVTTMVGLANYSGKCWDYIFKGRRFFGPKTFVLYYCASIVFGSVNNATDMVNMMDIGYALMAWPNMIATLILARHVKMELNEYYSRYLESKAES